MDTGAIFLIVVFGIVILGAIFTNVNRKNSKPEDKKDETEE